MRSRSATPRGFREVLPDLRDDDVIGSAYCVRAYELEPRFGSPDALAVARAELAARGIGLILDFVPNHVAPDHDWTATHPEHFIRGDAADLEADPAAFVRTAGGVLANGKDPYFAPWPDVVQLDAFAPGLRAAAIDTLSAIGGSLRRRALRHGDAHVQRGLRAHVGRACGRGAVRGLLADGHRRRARRGAGPALHRGGLLGHGVDAPAARASTSATTSASTTAS